MKGVVDCFWTQGSRSAPRQRRMTRFERAADLPTMVLRIERRGDVQSTSSIVGQEIAHRTSTRSRSSKGGRASFVFDHSSTRAHCSSRTQVATKSEPAGTHDGCD